MPAIYAHERFGKMVYQQMDSKMKQAIRANKELFEIGLQGPDFLFFYKFYERNRVNQVGYDLHEEPVREFLTHSLRIVKERGKYSPEAVYIYGFICHFVLDSECHWYVEQQVKKTGVGHLEIESELEKVLMKKDKHFLLSYPVWKIIPTSRKVAKCMAQFYPEITVDELQKALIDMRFCKYILANPTPGKRKVVDLLMRMTGQYHELKGHMLRVKTNPRCVETVKELLNLYDAACKLAPYLIQEYQETVFEKKPWNPRFNRNLK
ncbi:MAG: zinc dependent phospholipase C family protein [bacterium]|nr:zinc dependent phospholipase C family protein [bacterium]